MPRPHPPHPRHHPKRPFCQAQSKQKGKRCKNRAIPGGYVCLDHGGSTKKAQAAARERLADLIDPDGVLRELAKIGTSDIRRAFDDKGNLRQPHEWPDVLAAAIAGTETVKRNITGGDGETDTVIKIKLWDKPKALEILAKHFGLLKEQVEHSGGLEITWQK